MRRATEQRSRSLPCLRLALGLGDAVTFEAKQATAILNAFEAWVDERKDEPASASIGFGYDRVLGRHWAATFGIGGGSVLVHGETLRDALAQLAQIAAAENDGPPSPRGELHGIPEEE